MIFSSLFFVFMTRQKKLRLSGSLYRFLIICTDMTCQKGKRNFSYRGLFRLLCVKGAVGASRLRDCFFYNPSRRGLQVCFAHSQIPPTAARFPNPSRRRLQACFAHSQLPLHKGAFLSIVLFFDLLSYLLSQKSPPVRRAFCFFILRLLWFLQQAFLREFLRISLKQPHSL